MARGQLDIAFRRLRNVLVAKGSEHLTDAELLHRFVDRRDEAAFTVLVRRHGGFVLNVCRHVLHREADAEDAFQSTFLVLARKAASFRKGTSLTSWLHGIAFRCAKNLRKSVMRRHEREKAAAAGRLAESPVSGATMNELQSYLDEEIARLPEKYRAPFLLCCLEGKSRAEAVQLLGWNEGTLATRLAKAREILQKRLTARGVTLSAALCAVALSPTAASVSVSAALADNTTQAALAFVARNAAGGASAQVLALAQGVLRGMLINKLKLGMALILVTCLGVSTAGGLVADQKATEIPAPKSDALIPPPQAAKDKVEPKNEKPVDAFGDPLPANAVARLGTERFRVAGWVDQIVVVPGGKHLLAHGSASVVLLDAATGREVRQFEPPRWRKADQGTSYSVQIDSFALSPDGHLLAAGTKDGSKLDCPILLFDFASGRKLGELPGHKSDGWSANRSLAFASPTRLLSAGADHTVRVWDVTTHREIHRLEMPADSSISGLTVSVDGKQVFGVGRDETSSFWAVWDVGTGKCVHREDKLPGSFVHLALSPESQTIAISVGIGEAQKDGGSNEVRIYSALDRKELRRWQAHAGQFPQRSAIAFAPDGRIITTGGADQKVRSWNAQTGKEKGPAIEPYRYANNVAYLDATTLITFGAQHAVKLWDPITGRSKLDFVGSESHLTAVAYSPDSRHVATGGGGGDSTIRIWDTAAGKQVAHLKSGELYDVTSLRFSPDGKRIVSGDSGGTARLWDWAGGKEIRAYPDHKPWLQTAAFSPDGKAIATGDDAGVVRVWDLSGDKPMHTLAGHTAHVTSLVFSPDGRTLFSGSWDHSIRQWDLAMGKEVRVIKGVQTATEQRKPAGHTNVVTDLALSADGRRLFSGSYDHRICVWEVSSGQLCRLLKGQSLKNASSVRALALSPAGTQLAAAIEDGADEGRVHVWDVLTGEKIGALAGHRGSVTRLAFAPNGKRLVSSSVDTTAIVWDVTGFHGPPPKTDAKSLSDIWEDVTDPDAEKAYTAVCRLVAAEDTTVAVLRGKVVAATRTNLSMAPALIKQLDDREFRTRELADQSLKRLGLPIEPLVRRAIANKPSLEVKRRLERILAEFAAEILQQDRALEVLEMIGTPNARAMLADLANGEPEPYLTRMANDAIRRLDRPLAKPHEGP